MESSSLTLLILSALPTLLTCFPPIWKVSFSCPAFMNEILSKSMFQATTTDVTISVVSSSNSSVIPISPSSVSFSKPSRMSSASSTNLLSLLFISHSINVFLTSTDFPFHSFIFSALPRTIPYSVPDHLLLSFWNCFSSLLEQFPSSSYFSLLSSLSFSSAVGSLFLTPPGVTEESFTPSSTTSWSSSIVLLTCSLSKLSYLLWASFSCSSIALSTSSKSILSNPISWSLMLLTLSRNAPVLGTSIPPLQVLATGSKDWETISDMWSFCPDPALTTGLVGAAVPVSKDQPLWSLNSRYSGATLRLCVILSARILE